MNSWRSMRSSLAGAKITSGVVKWAVGVAIDKTATSDSFL